MDNLDGGLIKFKTRCDIEYLYSILLTWYNFNLSMDK